MRIKALTTMLLALLMQFLCHWQATGESLPNFKQDASFKQGRLANGMHYYFAANKSQKGMFNMSLVQKMDYDLSIETLDSLAANNLMETNSLSAPLRELLTRNGVAPAQDGYYTTKKGAICYNFNNLSSAFHESVIDSTLMAIFDMAKFQALAGTSSDAQALIIAGDFDQTVMLAKMRLLSLILPKVDGEAPAQKYVWDSLATPHNIVTTTNGSLAKVEALWVEARTPAEYIKTVLPVISDKLAGEFGWVLKRRMEPVFLLNKLNVWSEFSHISSTDGPGDEQICFTVNCMTKDAPLVEDIMRREFQRLLTWGIEPVEYEYARDAYMYNWKKRINRQITPNTIPQSKCIAAFLYGAPLCSEKEQMKFAYREMPLEQQAELFNNYMRKLLSQNTVANESLSRVPLIVSRSTLDNILNSYTPSYSMKIPKDKVEPITGGTIWTLSNGVNVIYKKMNTNGISYFAYASRGGRSEEDDEAITTISGIQPDALSNYMSANGMDMKVKLTSSDVRINGDVMADNTELLFKLLVAFSTQAANKDILGPECYKLLVVASDMENEAFSALVSKYGAGLRKAKTWTAGNAIEDEREDIMSQRGYTIYESTFPFDRTGTNQVVANVAAYALNDALVQEFSDAGILVSNWSYFPAYPPGKYKLLCGVRRYHALGLADLKGDEVSRRMRATVKNLSQKPVSTMQLNKYKGLTKLMLESHKGTAEFYIATALDRYLDNKNFSARYHYLVDKVTAEEIRNFYAAAADSNR